MNPEGYTAVERDVGCELVTLSRREMLKLLGSGIIILIDAPAALPQVRQRSLHPISAMGALQPGQTCAGRRSVLMTTPP